MLITGTATCKYCGKLVEWYYEIPNRMSDGIYNVEEIPEGKIGSSGKPCRLGEKRYEMSFWCPKCGCLSNFEYESEIDF